MVVVCEGNCSMRGDVKHSCFAFRKPSYETSAVLGRSECRGYPVLFQLNSSISRINAWHYDPAWGNRLLSSASRTWREVISSGGS